MSHFSITLAKYDPKKLDFNYIVKASNLIYDDLIDFANNVPPDKQFQYLVTEWDTDFNHNETWPINNMTLEEWIHMSSHDYY